VPNLLKPKSPDKTAWGSSGDDAKFLRTLRYILGKIDEEDRRLILHMTQKMAKRE